MSSHSERPHARLAPSAAERWFECPGSIRASEGVPDTSSAFADEGTAAHELAHRCSRTGFDADRFAGMFVNLDLVQSMVPVTPKPIGARSFEVTDEMADAVQQYLDYTRELTNAHGAETEYEQWTDLSWVGVEGLDGGTADFSCYNVETGVLDLVDFKYGRGVVVEPSENKQLLCYALGVVRRWANRGLNSVRLTIVQPRASHHSGPIRTWDADVLSVFDFEDELRKAALATYEKDAPLRPGSWCKFCPAGATCSARRAHALSLAEAEFDPFDKLVLAPAPEMTGEKLARVLAYAEQIEAWCRSVKEYAHAEAVHGRMPPGFKLVAKRAMRKWKNEEEAATQLYTRFALGFDEHIYVRKMKSPAQIEQLLPGKNKGERAALIENMICRESSGVVLAPDSDLRPSVQADAAGEFEEVSP